MLSRASSCLFVFKLRAHWLLDIFSIPLIGCSRFSDLQSKCSPTNPEVGERDLGPDSRKNTNITKLDPDSLSVVLFLPLKPKCLSQECLFFSVDKLYCYSAILTYSCFKIGWVFTVPGMEM